MEVPEDGAEGTGVVSEVLFLCFFTPSLQQEEQPPLWQLLSWALIAGTPQIIEARRTPAKVRRSIEEDIMIFCLSV